jgi:tetratricopeptide (TPR) repeat protein
MAIAVPAAIALLALASGVARAEDAQKAREAYRTAARHYDLGEYREALDGFKEAYRNLENPALLFNIAQCHRHLGERRPAIRAYEAYLRRFPDAPDRDEIGALIAGLEKELANEQTARSSPQVTRPPAPARARRDTPLYKRWWLWTTVAAVAVGAGVGVGLGVGLSPSSATPEAPTDFGTIRF